MGRKSLEKDIDLKSKKRLQLALQAFPYFQEMGLKSFKMDMLASMLGKSKTTIYKYFVGREDLIELIIDYKLTELEKFEDHLFNEELNYIERNQRSVQHIVDVLHGISNKFLFDISDIYPELWQRIQEFRIYASSRLEEYYIEGVNRGIFKGIHPQVLILNDNLFFEAILSKQFLTDKSGLTVEDALNDYFKLKFHGLLVN
jgi:AcrR family transcriptional regulator